MDAVPQGAGANLAPDWPLFDASACEAGQRAAVLVPQAMPSRDHWLVRIGAGPVGQALPPRDGLFLIGRFWRHLGLLVS